MKARVRVFTFNQGRIYIKSFKQDKGTYNVNEGNSWYLKILISNYHNLAATSIKQKLEESQGKHMNILK